jgi:hypothetical protein
VVSLNLTRRHLDEGQRAWGQLSSRNSRA